MKERLHKVLAHAGVASRRAAERMILDRRVRVNGTLVLELGTQVDPSADHIEASCLQSLCDQARIVGRRRKRSGLIAGIADHKSNALFRGGSALLGGSGDCK